MLRTLSTRETLKSQRIGLGCWLFGKSKLGNSDAIVRNVVAAAIARNIRLFDTAESYGWGISERRLASALESTQVRPDNVLICTKWYPFWRKAASITSTFKERISALAPYPIGIHHVHAPASFSSVETEMEHMLRLYDAGLIGGIGVSNFTAKQMLRAHYYLRARGVALVCNQVGFSIFDRAIEKNGILETAKAEEIAIVAHSPLGGTLRHLQSPRSSRQIALAGALQGIALKHNSSMSSIALAWVTQFHEATVVAIPGARNERQVQENTMNISLSLEELSQIDLLTREHKGARTS
ncbi:MAG: aldo/keto reductase [Steroidobacteraceae bacterium]